jgi:hypothetical protein
MDYESYAAEALRHAESSIYSRSLSKSEKRRIITIAKREALGKEYPFLPYHVLSMYGTTTKNIKTLNRYGIPVESLLPYFLMIQPKRFRRNLETWLSYRIPREKLTHRAIDSNSKENLEAYITNYFPEYSKWKAGIPLKREEVCSLLEDGNTMHMIKSGSYVSPLIEETLAKRAIKQMRGKKVKDRRIIEELNGFGFSEAVLNLALGGSLRSLLIDVLSEEKIKNPEEIVKGLERCLSQGKLDNIHLKLSQYRIPFEKGVRIRERLREAFG